MKTYHKIPTVFKRDPENNYKTLLYGQFATPELDALSRIRWNWTEKVDGTNIRVMWDGENVSFGGKTDRAELPKPLVEKLKSRFTNEAMAEQFGAEGGVCLYGEGYGGKIQKGSKYNPTQDFVLFDVLVGSMWLRREDVVEIGERLIKDAPCGYLGDLSSVPDISFGGTLFDAVYYARHQFDKSCWGDFEPEGLVMRPEVELQDRRGNRIICKIKLSDFQSNGDFCDGK